jgi:hypothetical protein
MHGTKRRRQVKAQAPTTYRPLTWVSVPHDMILRHWCGEIFSDDGDIQQEFATL